jgi:uncharacterized protein (TIGR03437 family)
VSTRAIVTLVSGLLLASAALLFAATGLPFHPKHQALTPAAAGPYRIAQNRILDSRGRAFLLRGTELPEFHPQTAAFHNRATDVFGAHSATSLSAIRLRFNMNAVRLPLDTRDTADAKYLSELAKVVRRANGMEMVVVLAAREPGAPLPTQRTVEFWQRCAGYFKNYPNVFFDAFSDPDAAANSDPHSSEGWAAWRAALNPVIHAIRDAGAAQPIVAMSWHDARLFAGIDRLLDDPNVIYGVAPEYTATATDVQRDAHFGFLAARVPLMANGWDLKLDDPAACEAIPHDPSAASALVNAAMDYYDARDISWSVSRFQPGKLIKDLADHDATSLENGWTCGKGVDGYAGMGRIVEAHLRGTEERGLFVVSGAGGMDIGRGGFALAYGPVMATRDAQAGPHPPAKLGGIGVQITDSAGVTRPAGMLWASAGWGQTNFAMPQESALGPARMTIVRDDGSRAGANILIVETAPGFITGYSCRGPVKGEATQTFSGGRTVTSQISECPNNRCRTLPVPLSNDAVTTVRLQASGVRHAASASLIELTVGGVRVPVLSYGPAGEQGQDFVTVRIPQSLHNAGETDLVCHLNGRVSNVVRIRLQ